MDDRNIGHRGQRVAQASWKPRAPPPRFRTLFQITIGVLALVCAFVAGNLRDIPTASAHPHDDQYDLCTRTPAVTNVILTDLRAWGAAQSPADTRYDAASNFGCAAGQTANISAADLFAHKSSATKWESAANLFSLDWQLSSIKPGDFAGLDILALELFWTSIKELPARAFDGMTLNHLFIHHAPQLETLHVDAFKGLTIDNTRFVLEFVGAMKLDSRRHTAQLFLTRSATRASSTPTQASTSSNSVGPTISHINTRWFASFAKTGTQIGDGIGINPHWQGGAANAGRGIIDTYYYDDGDGRYTDGTETTLGEVSILSSTTKATLGTAITNEVKRYAEAKTGNTFTIGSAPAATVVEDFSQGADNANPFIVTRTNWGSVDICSRTPAVRDAILAELRTEQPTI